MITVHTLASGSSGNAVLVRRQKDAFLIDAGISCRRISQSLQTLGLELSCLSGILVTHTHHDHISGLQTLLKRTQCPIFSSEPVCQDLSFRFSQIQDRLFPIGLCGSRPGDACSVTAFPTSHDSPGSCGFRFDFPEGSVGLFTDTGFVTQEAADILPGVDLAVLEANHDVETLRGGSYPYYLKRRILGAQGHLSNPDAARFAVVLAQAGASQIILAHLSQENNTPDMARLAVGSALRTAGLEPELSVAPRDRLSDPYFVSRRAVCRK